ncbi:MAG: ABC transporter permease [Proteobacteria bacterium]|nr:ABC transporter permease [Desulfobacula sp.]MBU3952759.1 ABC transporter permease [Pseudomonadota bacterium]MBU4130595.1 ABC transporter permease [Pseudomonadota bacterium]
MKLYNISLGNIRRRKGKMLFLALGLIIGVSTIVTLLAITETMTADIEERLNQFGANIVMVPKTENLSLNYGGIDVGGVSYEVIEFDQENLARIHTIKNAKNLGVVAPKVLGQVNINEKRILLMGVIFDQELALKTWWQKKGTFPANLDEVLLGSSVASVLGLSPGDKISMGDAVFTVSGVLNPTGASEDNAVIAELGAAQTVLGKKGKITLVEISAFCRGCPISEMTLQIAEAFPNAKVTAMKQAVMSKMQSMEMFKSFSLGVSILVIGIGALLVMVTMMGSVNERTREIGIFRAIGFRQTHVMQIILLEALVLGLFGGVFGFVLGNLVAWGIIPVVIKDGVFVGINYQLGGLCLVMAAALSLLASLYPAFKAGRMDPSDALRAL